MQHPDVKDDSRVQDSGRDKAKIREVILAFSLDEDKNLQPLKNTPLYVFLPSNYTTGLRFAVQGDFILDTQRSRVDNSIEWNRWLMRCAEKLLIAAIEGSTTNKENRIKGFKDAPMLRYQFYRALPVKNDFPSYRQSSNIVWDEFVQPFWQYCKEAEIVAATSPSGWAKSEECILASREVQELMDAEKLDQLTKRRYFVHPQVQESKFLTEIGVTEFKDREIFDALKDRSWVQAHDVEWFKKLYAFLANSQYRFQWELQTHAKELPIILTTDGQAKAAGQVLFAPKSKIDLTAIPRIPGITFMAPEVLNKESHSLAEKLGVQEFNHESIIRNVILPEFEGGYWKIRTDEQIQLCIAFVKKWLKENNWRVSSDLKQRLGAIRVRVKGGKRQKAEECYFPEPSLKKIYPHAHFVVFDAKDDEQRTFLETLGVSACPKILVFEGTFERYTYPKQIQDWEDYWCWLWSQREESTRGESIAQIKMFENWGKIQWDNKIAQSVLDSLVRYWSSEYQEHIWCSYKYFYRTNKSKQVYSYFAWEIRKTSWLPTTKGLQEPSSKIFLPVQKVKEIAGDLPAYVIVPDGWNKDEFIKKGAPLFQFLDLRDELGIGELIYLLEVASQQPVNDDLKKHLARIYHQLGLCLEKDAASIDPVSLRTFRSINLLTTNDEFVKIDKQLLWNDDPSLGDHFQDSERFRFVWIPKKDVELTYIKNIFQASRVACVSENIHREKITSSESDEKKLFPNTISDKAKYLYSLLKHHQAQKSDLGERKLPRLKMVTQPVLDIILWLDREGLDREKRVVQLPAFYDLGENIFYKSSSATMLDIAMELARVFKLDRGGVPGITMVLMEDKHVIIEDTLEKLGVNLLDLDNKITLGEPIEKSEEDNIIENEPVEEESPDESSVPTQDEPGKVTDDIPKDREKKRSTGKTVGRKVEQVVLPYEERLNREGTNIERIIEFERSEGRDAQNVSRENRGYDIESMDKQTDETRNIEVKSSTYVMLTPNEYKVAQDLDTSYYLYVVDSNDDVDTLYIVRNPRSTCRIDEIETMETRWKIKNWREEYAESAILERT